MSNVLQAVFGESSLEGSSAPQGVIPPTLQAFYDKIGPLPEPKHTGSPDDFAPVQRSSQPLDREDGAMWLQEALPGTNPVEHERDLLYVVNYAMEQGNVRTMTELASWLQTQLAYAQREGQWQTDDRYKQPPPDILQLATYLRRQAMARRY